MVGFAEFTDATGQHRQRVELAPAPFTGTFGWTQVKAKALVPATASRLRVFLGMLPGTGDLLVDDVSIKVE